MADNLCRCKNPLLFAERIYGDLCSIEKLLQDSGKEVELISKLETDLKITELKVKVGVLLNGLEAMGFSDGDIPKLNTSPLGSDVIKETFWQKDDNDVVYIPDLLTVKELAEKIGTKPAKIVSKLFLKGELVQLDSVINYNTALKIADEFDVIFQRME